VMVTGVPGAKGHDSLSAKKTGVPSTGTVASVLAEHDVAVGTTGDSDPLGEPLTGLANSRPPAPTRSVSDPAARHPRPLHLVMADRLLGRAARVGRRLMTDPLAVDYDRN
jgi:hypothetical protein